MIKFLGKRYIIDIFEISKFISLKKDGEEDSDMGIEIEETYQLGEVEIPAKKGKKASISNEMVKTMEVIRHYQRGKEIDAVKYEMIKAMMETLLNETEEVDENLGEEAALAKYSVSFKFAFNTLIYYKILKTIQ